MQHYHAIQLLSIPVLYIYIWLTCTYSLFTIIIHDLSISFCHLFMFMCARVRVCPHVRYWKPVVQHTGGAS